MLSSPIRESQVPYIDEIDEIQCTDFQSDIGAGQSPRLSPSGFSTARTTSRRRHRPHPATHPANPPQNKMRASLLSLALSAGAALAAPAIPGKVEPNNVDILGGDFGLPNTAINTEVWNQLSLLLASSQGSSDPAAASATASSLLGLLGKSFGSVASGFGGELTRWLSEQAKFWAFGTDDLDTTNVICSLWENPEVLLSGLFKGVGPPARKGERCRKSLDGGTGAPLRPTTRRTRGPRTGPCTRR